METKDILNIFLVVAVIIIAACVVYVTYYFVQALKSITSLADELDNTAQSLKDRIQLKALAAVPALLVTLVGKLIKKKRG